MFVKRQLAAGITCLVLTVSFAIFYLPQVSLLFPFTGGTVTGATLLDNPKEDEPEHLFPSLMLPDMKSSEELMQSKWAYNNILRNISNPHDGGSCCLMGHEEAAVRDHREYPLIKRMWQTMNVTLPGAYGELFKRDMMDYLVTPQHFAYYFHAMVLPPEAGPYILMVSPVRSSNAVPEYGVGKFWGSWMVNVMVDRRCKIVQMASFLLPVQRALQEDWMVPLWKDVLPTVLAACNNRTGMDSAVELPLRTSRQNFYCVNEIMAYGDLSFHLVCFARVWARYPTAALRRKVTVVLAQPAPFMQIARNFYDNVIVKYLTEIDMLWLPTDRLLVAPTLVVPFQGPEMSNGARAFLDRVLYPRVEAALTARNYTRHKRIALVSTGFSLTNRSFRPSEQFNALLQRHGFVIFPPDLPHDERIFYGTNAEFLVSSHGSAQSMFMQLTSRPVMPPMLCLCHSAYFPETPFHVGRNCHGKRLCTDWPGKLLVALSGDDLNTLTDADMRYFLSRKWRLNRRRR